ncbi:PREDICTED: histone H2B type 1-P-like [Ipomoea nil]|uniref:histone H2B type 1-P-like n=1 Tax=Ipomoea nil TaxID=35883 RepID=UPI000901EECB|nr:PREDICTED: histone H2B type 1-P-like [Ipomoea nil]
MAPRKRRGRLSAVVTSRKVVEETVQVVVTAAAGETEYQSQPNVDAFASQVSDNGTEQVEVSTPPAQEEPPIVKRTIPVEDKSGDESPPPLQNQENEEDETQPASEPEQIPAPPLPKKKEEEQTKRSTRSAPRDGGGGKRKRKRRWGRSAGSGEGYKRYVFKVMKQVHPDLAISSKAMTVINNLMGDMFERIAVEAATLSKYISRATLSSREIQDAVKLVLPGDLGKHAIAEGTKAVTTYLGTKSNPKPN